jgi:hypothetical protein
MGMKSLIVALFLFCCFIVSGRAGPQSPDLGTLSGDIKYAVQNKYGVTNEPLPQAFVFVHCESGTGDRVLKVDWKAHFEVALGPGFYDVLISCNGFAPTCRRFFIEKNQRVEFAAMLQNDLQHTIAD